MPVGYFGSISFVDKADKPSTVQYFVDAADAIDDVTDPTTGAIADLNAAIAAVSLLAVTGTAGGERDAAASPTLPTDDQAYRSSKLTVFYHDTTTGKPGTRSIPGRNTAKYNTYPRSKNVILTVAAGGTAEIETLVTAFNATVRSDNVPHNNVLVDSIVVSGKNQG